MTYDLIIIGGGPAGAAGGVYAARKKLKTLFLTGEFGGQSSVSAEIQNWIGTKSISGNDLAHQLKEHLFAYQGEDLTIKEKALVKVVSKNPDGSFTTETSKGDKFESKTILIATGAIRRKLAVLGADTFDQKGLTYCATCDGPLFTDKAVAVIGGGNAAFETAMQLSAYCQSVTLLHHSAEFKADAITVEKVKANPKVAIITNAETIAVKGDKFVNALVYKDKKSGAEHELKVEGIFVEIGLVPNSNFVNGVIDLTPHGSIITNPRNQQTSTVGVWAAGDVTDGLYHQNNIAAGDAIKAVEDLYSYLHLR